MYRSICKGCGKPFLSTELALQLDVLSGRSPSARCDECRARQRKFLASTGLGYFEVLRVQTPDQSQQVRGKFGLSGIGRVLPHPESLTYPGSPTPEALAKFAAVTSTMDELVATVLDPQGPRYILAIMPTGTGKSVYLPYRLLTSRVSKLGKIYVTEPRLSVLKPKEPGGDKTIPWYIGTQLLQAPPPGYGKGFEVGAWFAGETSMYDSYNNRLIFVSDGLLRVLAVSGALADASVIVIDEAHEKSENMASLFTLFRVLIGRYPKLKIVFASATIDPKEFVDFYHPAPVRVFAPRGVTTQETITVNWPTERAKSLSSLYQQCNGYLSRLSIAQPPLSEAEALSAVTAIVQGIRTIPGFTHIDKPMGDIIVFVATKKMVKAAKAFLEALRLPSLKVYVCHRDMTGRERSDFDESENRAIAAVKNGTEDSFQRVIVATNYVQTGITITARYVIDTGFVLEPVWRADVASREYLVTTVSQDAARQRWGRISRLAGMPGEVFCIYTAEAFEQWPMYTEPEVTRTNLDGLYLNLAAAGIGDLQSIRIFGIDESSSAQRLEQERALRQLTLTGAVDAEGDVTQQGMLIRESRTSLINYALLLIHAEQLACLLEVAVFMAFIERDGSQSLFQESEQGVLAYERWRTGIIDDLEFYLRLFVHWQAARQLSHKRDSHRAWSTEQGLNHDVFLDIERSRDRFLEPYQRKVHESVGNRQLDLERIHRVRAAIARAMPEWIFRREGGLGPLTTYVSINPDNCPPATQRLAIDRESACLARALDMLVCIDRTVVNRQAYARHVVYVNPSWMDVLHADSVVPLVLALDEEFQQNSTLTQGVAQRILTEPSDSLDITEYGVNSLVHLSVIRYQSLTKEKVSCYLVSDLDRGSSLVVSSSTRLNPGDVFRAVITKVRHEEGIVEVSQQPLIERCYHIGQIVRVTAINALIGEEDSKPYAWFMNLETGIDARLMRRSYGFFDTEFESIQVGTQLSLKISQIKGDKIDVEPIGPEFSLDEKVTGLVDRVFSRRDGTVQRIKLQLAPSVWGILDEKRTTYHHLGGLISTLVEGTSLEVKIHRINQESGGSQYELAHLDFGSLPVVGRNYFATVCRFYPSDQDRMLAFLRFLPGLDGTIHRSTEDLSTFSIDERVWVELVSIDTEKQRYSLKLGTGSF